MSTYFVRFGLGTIKITIATTQTLVDEGVRALMSNPDNSNRCIGVDIIMKRSQSTKSSTAVLLQLSDEFHCLIVRLHYFTKLPESLYNFLSLPAFTFCGFGIKETMSTLKHDHGLMCKNTLEVGPSKWHLSRTAVSFNSTLRYMILPASSSISDLWDAEINLTEEMIKIAFSNALVAFHIGDKIIRPYF